MLLQLRQRLRRVLLDLLILPELRFTLILHDRAGVIGFHAGDVMLVQLIGGQRRDDLHHLLLDLRKLLRKLQANLLRGLLKLLLRLLVILHDALGELLHLWVLRLLRDLLRQRHFLHVAFGGVEHEQLVGSGVRILRDLLQRLHQLLIRAARSTGGR